MIQKINGMKSFQYYDEEVIDVEPETELGKYLTILRLFYLNFMHFTGSFFDYLNQSLINGEHKELIDTLKNDPQRFREKCFDLMTESIKENFPDIGE